ncbi:AAA family ATPase [Rosettibacter firmus]|uniref:AAA family ATPase n=1 Tax=Rosettibacter firmus TaxID=3111522 RepID=UPI00336C16A4
MTNEELNNLQAEAYEHLWNGRYRLALSTAEKVYQYRPDDSEAAICLAWAYLENGNPSKALEFANLAVELKGESSHTRFFRAYLLSRLSIFEGAIADIEKSIKSEKELLSWTYLTLARSYAGLNKFDNALNVLKLESLLENENNQAVNKLNILIQKAKQYTSKEFEFTSNRIKEILNDAIDAIKSKEYWFSLLTSRILLSLNISEKIKEEAELIELESMFHLFQYRPALKKAESLKSKFNKNQKFNFIYNSLKKYLTVEEESQEEPLQSIKIKHEYSFELPDLSNIEEKVQYKFKSIAYPNDYVEIISIKIFDSDKEIKTGERSFYKQIDQNINWLGAEVIFNNPFYQKENRSYDCSLVWYINDFEIGRNEFKLNIPKDWDSIIFTQNMGSDKSGFWKKGQAKVEVYINNFKVGEKYFGIDDTRLNEEEFTPPEPKTKTKETQTSTPVIPASEKNIDELLAELDSFIGLNNIKQAIRDFISYLEFIKERKKFGLKTEEKIAINAVFLGNPGSGKTTIARLLGSIFKAMGILPSGHVVEVDRAGLVGQYIGETAQKTEKVINDAMGGVLFIDEAYTLVKKGSSSQDFGQEAIDILLKRMEDRKGEFVVIAAGYTDEMNAFLESNPGLKSRFTHTFIFEDYTPDELVQILNQYLKKEEYNITNDALEFLHKEFINLYRNRDKSFGNARLIRKIFEEAKINLSKRVLTLPEHERTKDKLNTITIDDILPILRKDKGKDFKLPINEEALQEALNELNNLVGLKSVKKEINDLVKLARFFAEQGEDLRDKIANHYLFLGNPGTGKTTVARIFSKIFSALGVLSKGHLVETDRQGLVAGYVGQTAEKTTNIIDKAIGGTLFIDEAYSLTKPETHGTDFGREAIDILLKRMEDDRGKFIVIAAGYTDEMKKFIASNPGLESRFTKSIYFEDYTPEEMFEIIKRNLLKDKKKLTEEAETLLKNYFNNLYKTRDKKFGNARVVRNIYELLKQKLMLRIADLPPDKRTEETLSTIIKQDIIEVIGKSSSASEYQVKGDPLKLQEYMDELNSLVGLEKVKEKIYQLISGSKIIQLKKERGLHVIEKNLHSIFIGNDGTGKTTVAKILSKILKELGILEKGHLIKVNRTDLVVNYQGKTASNTDQIIREALGGILFIDEAYELIQSNDDFGYEAISTILRRMSEYKTKFIVILSGITSKMNKFMKSYPDIIKNFSNIIEFDDYNPRQLLSISYLIANSHGYELDEGALQMLLEIFTQLYEKRDENFRNAFMAKSILYSAITKQEQRISSIINPTDEDLKTITLEDVMLIEM